MIKQNLSKFLWFWFLNIFYQLLVILLLVLKSGDIHLNPGPELKNIHTLEAYQKNKDTPQLTGSSYT